MTGTTERIDSLPLPPGNSGLPFIGETISFFNDSEFHQKRIAKYGKVYRTHVLGSPMVIAVGAEANTFLFRNENKYVVSTWPKSTRILLGASSLAVSGVDTPRFKKSGDSWFTDSTCPDRCCHQPK